MKKQILIKANNITIIADAVKITQKGFIDLYKNNDYIGFIEAKKLEIYKKGIHEGPTEKIKIFSLKIKEA